MGVGIYATPGASYTRVSCRSRVLKFERVEGRTHVGQGLVAARVSQGVKADPQALSVRDDGS